MWTDFDLILCVVSKAHFPKENQKVEANILKRPQGQDQSNSCNAL